MSLRRRHALAMTAAAASGLTLIGSGCGGGEVAARPLGPVSQASGCVERHGLPDPRCTPGAVDPRVNPSTAGATVCRRGYTRTIRPPRRVTARIKRERLAAYGQSGGFLSDFELDHLVPLELGGAPAAVANLWPEPRAGAYSAGAKDDLERALNQAVCQRRLGLAEAQRMIASDWEAAYRRFVGSPPGG